MPLAFGERNYVAPADARSQAPVAFLPLSPSAGIKGSLLLATVAVGTVVGATGAAKLATQRSAGHVPALPPPPPPADEHAHQD